MPRLIAASLLIAAALAGGAEAAVGPPPQAWTANDGGPHWTRSLPGDWLAPPLVQRWTAATGGTYDPRGTAQPVIAEDKVFVPSSHYGFRGDGDSGGSVYALDRLTGRRLWERALPAGRLAYDEGTLVLAGYGEPLAFGLDPATGRTRWVTATGTSGLTPVAYGGRLLLGGPAFDLRDGASLGRAFPGQAAIAGGTAYSGPILSFCGPLEAFDADTWERLWTSPSPPGCTGYGPDNPIAGGGVVVRDGVVRDALTGAVLRQTRRFAMTLADGRLIGLDTDGFPRMVVAEDGRTGVDRWSYESAGSGEGEPLAVGGTVYAVGMGGLYGRDLVTGEQTFHFAGPFTSLYTSLSAGQGTLIGRVEDDRVVALSRPGPDTRVSRRPAAHARTRSATFEFSSDVDGAGFECSLDGTAWTTCSSPLELSDLGEGDHRLEVRALDGGERDPAPSVAAWTVDTAAPAPSLEGGPSGAVASRTAAFGVRDGEAWALARCALDGAAPLPCRDTATLTGLADGEHVLTLTSRDLAGNTGTAQRTWTVDATPPETTIVDGPRGRVSSSTARFTMLASEQGASFRCTLDGGAETGCGSPQRYDGLADGAHRLEVAAIDALGNRDASPAVWTWSVQDGQPDPGPEPTATATPDPTAEPSSTPTADPTATPTAEPSPTPTAEPAATATPDPPAGGDVVLDAPRVALARRVSAASLRRGRVTVRVAGVPAWMTARASLTARGRTLAVSKRLKGRGERTLRLRLVPRKRMLRRPAARARLVVTLAADGERVTLRRGVTIVRRAR